MKKKISIILLLMLTTLGIQAKHMSSSEALQLAFSKAGSALKAKSMQNYQLAYSTDAFYAFNGNNGFIILAADNCVPDIVLGYSDNGSFDYEAMPDGMRYLLGELNEEIKQLATIQNQYLNRASSSLDVLDPIEPLTKSKWNQNSPWNLLAPTNAEGTHYAAGCVPVAMSQVMYFHHWPVQGTGANSYSWDMDGTQNTLSVDFSESIYDWANMCDTYGKSSTDEQCSAVAKLLLDCGISVNAKYKSASTTANSENVGPALIKYFDYDKALTHVKRQYYSKREWRDLLYDNLANGMPIYYRGQSTDGGHAFVCDGYKDGLFHINWGWSGMSDGYFQIELLEPAEQGIGGSTSGYQQDQAAILGIQPNKGNDYAHLMYCTGNINISPLTATTNDEVTLQGYFENDGSVTLSYSLGAKITDAEGNAQYLESPEMKDKEVAPYGVLMKIPVNLSGASLTEGTYIITPTYYDNNKQEWVETPVNKSKVKQYVIATVNEDGSIEFSYPTSIATINATSIAPRSRVLAGYDTDIDFTVACTDGEYLGNVSIAFLQSGTNTKVKESSKIFISIVNGEEYSYNTNVTNPTIAGTYDLVLLDANGNIISDRIAVSVEEAPTGDLEIKGTLKATNTAIDDLQFNLNLQCTSGVFNSKITIYMYESVSSAEPVGSIAAKSKTFLVEGDDPIDITFSGSFPDLTVGKYYYAYAYYANPSWILIAQRRFKATASTGIEAIESEELRVKSKEYYNLLGQKMTKPQHGIFVKDGKKVIIK